MTLIMLDSINVAELAWAIENGHKPHALAGYTSGNWPTLQAATQLAERHGIRVLSVAVNSAHDAMCLDIETGDATPAEAPAWVRRQHARGVKRPVLYSSASVMGAVRAVIREAGIQRDAVRLWSAHYTGQPHICGPSSCAYPGCPPCDATQWLDSLAGHNIDQSVLADDFFGAAASPLPVAPDLLEGPMLLTKGAGVKTPIALAAGQDKVRFFSNKPARIAVDVRDGKGTQTISLQYESAHTVDVPGGVHAIVVHREDDGENDVSAVTFG